MIEGIWEKLKDPTVYAALAGLAAALGWEVPNQFVDHMLGAVGVVSGVAAIVVAGLQRWKAKREPQP